MHVSVCIFFFFSLTPDSDFDGIEKSSWEPPCVDSEWETAWFPEGKKGPQRRSWQLGQTRWKSGNYTVHHQKEGGWRMFIATPLSFLAGDKAMPTDIKEKNLVFQQLSDNWFRHICLPESQSDSSH